MLNHPNHCSEEMIPLRAVINAGLPLMTLSRASAVSISWACSLFPGWMLRTHILPLKDDIRNYTQRISRNVRTSSQVKGRFLASLGSWLAHQWLLNALLLVWHMNSIWTGFESHSLSVFLLDLMWCPWQSLHKAQWHLWDRNVNYLLLRVRESKPSASYFARF